MQVRMVLVSRLEARQVAVDVAVFPLALGRVTFSTAAASIARVVGHLVGRSTVTTVRRHRFVLEAWLQDRHGRTTVDDDIWTDIDCQVVLHVGSF